MESQASPPLRSSGSFLDSAEVRLVLKVIQKNWWIALSLAAIGYTIGYFYAYRLPDIYAAQTQLIFRTNDQYNPNTVVTGFGSYQGYVDNANETRVIQSYDLIKKVIDKLNINVSYYIEGRLRKTEVYSSVPFKITPYYINPIFYEKEVSFTILDKYHYRIGYLKGDHQYTQDGNFGDDFINSDMKLHVSSTMDLDQTALDDVKLVEYQFKVHNTATLVGSFRSSMAVSSPDYTNIMVISLRDLIPNRAVAFLDTLDNVYLENSILTQIQRNINTINYIDKEMQFVSGIIDTFDIQIENYKEKKNILDFDKEGSDYYARYTAAAADKEKLNSQISSLNDLEQYIIEGKDPEFMPPSLYLEGGDQYIQQQTNKLYATQIKVMEALNTNTEQSQNITDAKKEIKRITDQILYYINNLRKVLNNKIAIMDTTMSSSMSEIRTMPEKRRGLVNMQRQEDVNTKLYETLLEKRANTIIEKASIIPQTKVLEKARSIGIVDPDRTAIYYKYMLIGLIIAGIIVAIRLFFFDRIESIQELKSKTSIPVLGEILSAPLLADLSFAVEDNPKSPLTESFRTLRTNLQYMLTNPSQKVILFTSNGPSEGKTFCSMNIGAILAKAEKKVLLLEFDLHKPRIHKVLKASPDKGITTVLIRKTTIEESIIPTPVTGLDVILCGPVPPNSSELVLSERVKDIINYGKEHYDYVVIDTPPLGFISDALVLMKLSDVNLFVLNTKFAYKQAINFVQDTIYANKVQNFGFVLNNVKRKKSRYYYNRYGYYGGYGYGGYGGYGTYGNS
jgi:tyrosine-protein kinase Etk/Wzc